MNLRDAYGMAYPLRDPNDVALDRYLRQYDEDDQREEFIETRSEELLAGDYSPYLPNNISEAIGELSQAQWAEISLAMKSHVDEAAGRLIRHAVMEYWGKFAIRTAEDEYNERDES